MDDMKRTSCGFDIRFSEQLAPDVICATLHGFLDAFTVIDFEREMDNKLRQGATRFVLNLGNLTYTSSAGIGAFMRLVQEVRKMKGDLVLVAPSENVCQVFDQLDFTQIFRFADSDKEAIAILQETI